MESLKSIASPKDKKSPFFLKNKEICEQWENYINSKSGIIKGKYSAWAFAIKAEIQEDNTLWEFDIRKSTMTNPSLLLNKKDVHLFLNIKASNTNRFQQLFTIRPRKLSDILLIKFNSSYKAINDNIILVHHGNIDNKLTELITQLTDLENSNLLKMIKYNHQNQSLSIIFRDIMLEKTFLEYLIK